MTAVVQMQVAPGLEGRRVPGHEQDELDELLSSIRWPDSGQERGKRKWTWVARVYREFLGDPGERS